MGPIYQSWGRVSQNAVNDSEAYITVYSLQANSAFYPFVVGEYQKSPYAAGKLAVPNKVTTS